MPFFSVVIPTFNRAKFLCKAIESVLGQTFADWELIIVDDGSTDNTKEIVAAFHDERINYYYQQNQERSVARNTGIKNSKGQYICFLDSDDYFLPERLDLLYRFIIEKKEVVAMFFTSICFDKEGIISERAQLEFSNNLNIYNYIIQGIIGVPQACIHKTIFNDFLFNPLFRYGEDMELWLRIADNYPLIFAPDQPTIIATIHEDRSVDERKYNSFAEVMVMLKTIFKKEKYGNKITSSVKNNSLCNCYFGIARYYIYKEKRFPAIAALVKSIFSKIHHPQLKYKLNIISKLINPFCSIQKSIQLIT